MWVPSPPHGADRSLPAQSQVPTAAPRTAAGGARIAPDETGQADAGAPGHGPPLPRSDAQGAARQPRDRALRHRAEPHAVADRVRHRARDGAHRGDDLALARRVIARDEARPPREKPGSVSSSVSLRLLLANVRGLQALRALHHVELDLLTLGEALEAVPLDRAVVAEHVLTTVVLRDEAEALRVVEPLHGASRHSHFSFLRFDDPSR